MKNRLFAAIVVSGALLLTWSCAGPARKPLPPMVTLTPPAAVTQEGALPKLAAALVLDGELSEWGSAACVPVRTRAELTRARGHEWRGPADAGMEAYCAWTPEGLAFAARVTDNEVMNDRPEQTTWQQDAIELFVDFRAPDKLMKAPYSTGAYQIMIRPPVAGRGPAITVYEKHGKIAGMQVAGKLFSGGYTVEALIPWQGAQPPATGQQIGMQFALDDCDSDDNGTPQARMLAACGATGLSAQPQNFIRWTLVDAMAFGDAVTLGPLVSVDGPRVWARTGSMRLAATVGESLSPRVAGVRMEVTAAGRTLVETEISAVQSAPPWEKSRQAAFDWTPPAWDGCCVVRTTLLDEQHKTIGVSERPVAIVTGMLTEAMERIADADISALSRRAPFAAAAWLGGAASVERFRCAAEAGDIRQTARAGTEMTARLDMLAAGDLRPGLPASFQVLRVTGDPEAQVIVEFPRGEGAVVEFCWGAMPLAGVGVRCFDTEDAAAKAFDGSEKSWIFAPPRETLQVAGRRATFTKVKLDFEPVPMSQLSADRHVFVIHTQRNWFDALAVDDVDLAAVDAVAVLPDCPPEIAEKVRAWAQGRSLPTLDAAEALKKVRVLVAGNAGDPQHAKLFSKYKVFLTRTHRDGAELRVLDGDRILVCDGPSRAAGERAIGLVIAGRTVTVQDVDALRADVVKDMAGRPESDPPEGNQVLCGDLHMHTFYSDGSPSPVALALEAMYCGLDFAVLSDHNTLEGARVLSHLLAKNHVAFPLIVGEEITTRWTHFNAYPLRELVSPSLTLEEMVKAVHDQGGAIQWNHPGYPDADWQRSQMARGLAGTGLDAWEHHPIWYDEWKRAGTLPALVGTTDTHDGTFSELERTVIYAPAPTGEAVAGAVRSGRCVMLDASGQDYLHASDAVTGPAIKALRQGTDLRRAKAERLTSVLRSADIPGLLRDSPARKVKLEEIGAK